MKRPYLFAAAVLLLAVFAGASSAAQPIYRNNVQTAQHILVPGTHVRIVPPTGARASGSFRGFEIASRGIEIRIEERMGVPYTQTASGLTPAALEADGIAVRDTGKVTLNGNPALLLYGTRGSEETGLLIFAFGEGEVSTLIYASYPSSDNAAVAMLRSSLLSAIFQAAPQAPDAGGGYALSTAGTALKFVGETSMVRYFTVDGRPVSNDVADALYTSAQRVQPVADADRSAFADSAMARYMSNYEHTVTGRRAVSYAGLQGFETVADFQGASRRDRTASGATRIRRFPGKGYQVVLFAPDGLVYSFSGIAVRDAENFLAQFRRITGTFRIVK